MVEPDPLSEVLSALADPTRRAIIARLSSGDATVNELAEPFDMSLPAVSKHLKVLEKAGLISRGREAQRRPARLEVEPLLAVGDWVEHYRKIWDQRFDRLDEYLHDLQAGDARSGGSRGGRKAKGRGAKPAAKPSRGRGKHR